MKKQHLTIFLVFISIGVLHGQDKEGYLGKKMYLSVEHVSNVPILYNVFSETASKVDANLHSKGDWFNWGYRVDFGYILKRNKAICLETGMDFFQVYPSTSVQNYNNYNGQFVSQTQNPLSVKYGVKQEPFNVRSFVFLPKFELAAKNSLLPLGLTHQVGFGFSTSRVQEKTYNAHATSSSTISNGGSGTSYSYADSTKNYQTYMYDFANAKPMVNLILMYAISLRVPISKNMMFHYGIRYTFNFHTPIPTVFSDYNSPYFYNNSEMKKLIARERMSSVLNLNLGLTYVF